MAITFWLTAAASGRAIRSIEMMEQCQVLTQTRLLRERPVRVRSRHSTSRALDDWSRPLADNSV